MVGCNRLDSSRLACGTGIQAPALLRRQTSIFALFTQLVQRSGWAGDSGLLPDSGYRLRPAAAFLSKKHVTTPKSWFATNCASVVLCRISLPEPTYFEACWPRTSLALGSYHEVSQTRQKQRFQRLSAALPKTVAKLERHRLSELAGSLAVEDDPALPLRLIQLGRSICDPPEPAIPQNPKQSHQRFAKALLALRCALSLDETPNTQPLEEAVALALVIATTAPTDRLRADALAALAGVHHLSAPEPLGRRCAEWSDDRHISWRIFREAMAITCRLRPTQAARIARDRLATKDKNSFRFRLFTIQAIQQSGHGLEILQAHLHAQDPSECVRQATNQAAIELALEQRSHHWREQVLEVTQPEKEKSKRVRARAAKRWCEAVILDNVDLGLLPVQQALQDPDELVRLVTLETIRSSAIKMHWQSQGDILVSTAWLGLYQTLLQQACDENSSPTLSEALADTLEAVRPLVRKKEAQTVSTLIESIGSLSEGESTVIQACSVQDAMGLGRAMAMLSQEDFGLYASVKENRIVIRRGTQARHSLWRVYYELHHPRPDKRRDVSHLVASWAPGQIRTHPATLFAQTPTRFAGERLARGRAAQWCRSLPHPDDLLALGVWSDRPVWVFSSSQVVKLQPPSRFWRRLGLRFHIVRNYKRLCDNHHASVDEADHNTGGVYGRQLQQLGITTVVQPYRAVRDADPEQPEVQVLFSELPWNSKKNHIDTKDLFGLALAGLFDPLTDLLPKLSYPTTNSIGQLAVFTAVAGSALIGYGVCRQWQTQQHRKKIPLTIGGWGTRGKSSLERLKAAMFQGFGYHVLCKTTGSTPCLLVGAPWDQAIEIPIYRSAGRASIWEQRDVLELAADLGVQVLTWECMAIRPHYARVMQTHWMKDPISTLTNTYPDHEEYQGPSALEVARSLGGWAAEGSRLVTAESTMLPLVRSEAKKRGATVVEMGKYDHELIPRDILDLFEDLPHRRNLSLLQLLARELDFDPDVALFEAAENQTVEIGALRTLGPACFRGRSVYLVNSMAANDPASTLDNLARIKKSDDTSQVVLANSRRDRPGRSQVFAKLLADQICAAGRVFTGDDAAMAYRYYRKAVKTKSKETTLGSGEAALKHIEELCKRIDLFDRGAPGVVQAIRSAFPPAVVAESNDSIWNSSDAWAATERCAQQILDGEWPVSTKSAKIYCTKHNATLAMEKLFDLAPQAYRAPLRQAWQQAVIQRGTLATMQKRLQTQSWCQERDKEVRRLFEETMLATASLARCTEESILQTCLAHAQCPEVQIISIQNIKGIGLQLLSSFQIAQRINQRLSRSDPVSEDEQEELQACLTQGLLPAETMLAAFQTLESNRGLVESERGLRSVAAGVIQRQAKTGWLRRTWTTLLSQLAGGLAPFQYAWHYVLAKRTMRRFAKGKITAAQAKMKLTQPGRESRWW